MGLNGRHSAGKIIQHFFFSPLNKADLCNWDVIFFFFNLILVGNDQVHSWTLVTSQALDAAWRIAKGSVMLAVSFLVAALCFFRRLHSYLGHRLKW